MHFDWHVRNLFFKSSSLKKKFVFQKEIECNLPWNIMSVRGHTNTSSSKCYFGYDGTHNPPGGKCAFNSTSTTQIPSLVKR